MTAAFYRCEVKQIQRSQGRSVVAAAAYRARTRLEDERQGMIFEYGAKARERLVYSAVRAPYSWAEDRQALWNAAELAEKRKDAQTGTEILVALSCDLSEEQNIALLEGFVQAELVDKGFAADFNYHDSPRLKGEGRQPHAHILRPKRRICADGLAPLKAREMDSREAICALREAWADHYNRALAKAGIDKRADHRSLAVIAAEAEELDDIAGQIEFGRPPEPKIGPVATQMVRDGREDEANAYTDAMLIREDRYERIEVAEFVRELVSNAASTLAGFPQSLLESAAEIWKTLRDLMGGGVDGGGADRERAVVQSEPAECDAPVLLPAMIFAEPSTTVPCRDGIEPERQEKPQTSTSIFNAARSLFTRAREAKVARAIAAAKKEAAAAADRLERNLSLAEQAALIGIDLLSPQAEQSFANDWIRTIRSADGSLEERYRQADRIALRNYVLRMRRYPAIGEIEKVLVRLSPFAGGVEMSARGAPEVLPDGMKADFRTIALFKEHVRDVTQWVREDAAVMHHLRETMRRALEDEFNSAGISAESLRGRYARHSPGKTGAEKGD
ncbi:MAG TPA: MobA/MobL family protein [Allosphingosinicella sp.]|jgi:hypothetical protein